MGVTGHGVGGAERLHIAVIGGSNASTDERAVAQRVGRGIAEGGAVLVCGGLGGVMEAACRGARDVGGTTVGILPGTDRHDANAHVEVAVPTGMGEARNAVVVRAADAVIAVGGEFGTLSEIAFALQAGTTVVAIGSWELARAGMPVTAVIRTDDPAEAVAVALRAARRRAEQAETSRPGPVP